MSRLFRKPRHALPKKSWLKVLGIAAVFSLFASPLNPLTPSSISQAVSYGANPCVQNVGSNTNVTLSTIRNGSNVVTDCVVSFTASTNTWTPPAGVDTIRLLVIGGGGSGGGGIGGGGGAGEMVESSSYAVSSGTSYSISIGEGGRDYPYEPGLPGDNTTFGSITAYGGGGGGSDTNKGPTASRGFSTYSFGSGGGGGYVNTTWGGSGGLIGVTGNNLRALPSGVNAYRDNGNPGSGGSGTTATGGGGGGAGGNGLPGTQTPQSGGNGGPGRSSDITGTAFWYAGGGGGGLNGPWGWSSGNPGAGGSSVGGAGGPKASVSGGAGGNGVDAVANTGSGGGGASNNQFGGIGGSGVVILRYAIQAPATVTDPVVSGTKVQGSTLSVSTGTWSFNPTSYSYRWERLVGGNLEVIPGATSNTYTLTSDDVGNYVTAVVTATNDIGSSTPKYAAESSTFMNRISAVVTYDYAGATGGNSTTSATFTPNDSTVANRSVTLPTPTKTGYTFLGWYTASSNGTRIGDAGATYSPTSSVTAYAQWSINTFTVTWDSNTGSSVSSPATFTVAQPITEPTPPTLSGKVFGGWSTSETANQGDLNNKITSWPYTPTLANTTLYAIWNNALIAYEPFTGTASSNLVGGAGSGSSGLTGNWILVNAVKQANEAVISHSYVSVTNLALPSNTSFTLPANNTAAHVSNSSWKSAISARQLTNPISFDAAGTYYYSFVNHMPAVPTVWTGFGMLGFLSGLPTSSTDTGPWSLYTGAAYSGVFGIDYGNANQTAWVSGQTRGTSAEYSAVSTKTSSPTTATTANFVVVKLVTSASGNDQIFLRAFSPSETLPLDDSSITWDTQYSTAITGSANYLAIESEWYGTLDEFRLGYTYGAVTGAAAVYTVTYEYNSATGGNSTTTANYIDGSSGLNLPTPTKTGYTFGGWYSESALTNQVGLGGATYSPSATGTLYAKWTKNNNTVTFNPNGGSGSATTQTIQTDTATALTSNAFTRLGYMFSTWNTIALGGGTSYTDGQSVTINGPINLYAQWTAGTYTATYNYNNATGGNSTASASYTTGGTVITLPSPTRTGYTFGGWYGDSGLTTQVGLAGASYSPTASLTLYAMWTADTYTVTYNYNSATSGNSTVSSSFTTGGSAITLPTPLRTGYTFGGWYAEVGLTTQIGLAGASYSPTATGTIYAKWTADTYTITYEYNGATGGNTVASANYTTGGTVVTLRNPTKTGYTFAGWYSDAGLSSFVANGLSTYSPTTSLTLYAKWTVNVCSPTTTTANGYTYYTFTSATTCEWSVPAGVSDVEAFVVGAGGGGGYSYNQSGAGGGAGGQVKTGQLTLGTTVTVTVGQGGTGGITTARAGTAGAASSISSITALGGGGGCGTRSACTSSGLAATTLAAAFGGSGGGGGVDGTGGGGSSGNATSRAGGAGTISNFSGSSVTYGIGGNGGFGTSGTSSTGGAGTGNRGNGGGGATATSSSGDINGGAGGSGLVILRIAATYTVTFDSKGGSSVTSGSYRTAGSIASAPTAPTKSGQTFLGWSATDGGSAISFPYSPGTTSNITLYALWAQSVMTVTYNVNGASGAPERSTDTYNRGASGLTLPTVGTMTKTGYTFDGWATTIGGAKLSGAFTTTADVTLYARWVAASYAITYNSNGATSGTPSATSGSYTTGGTAITLASQSTMSRTGYTFDGWSTTVNNAASKITNSGTYTISAPVILYALWNAIDYSVIYSTQGSTSGAAPTDSTLYNISQNVVVKANTGNLAKTGYSFAGWTIASDGSGTVYQSGDTYQVASSNITLYPKWTANTYTITYNTNGASGAPSRSSDSYTTGDPGLSLPNVGTMVRTGYDFAGWSPSASGSALSGNGYTTTSNVTLYAIWTLKTINYSYAYGQAGVTNLSGAQVATFPDTTTQSGLYGSRFNLSSTVDPVISAAGNSYKFMGWQYGNSIYSSGDQFTLGTSTATFTAVWVQLLEVRYALNGGTGVTSADSECVQAGGTCSDGQSIQLNGAPTRPGYTFTGWKDQSNANFAASATTNVSSSSFIFYAQWQAVNYTMSFNSVGGSVSNTNLTKNIGDTFTLPSPGTKTGYTFNGWFDGTSTYGQGATYTTGSTGVGFIALWTPNVYLVSYNWNGGVGTPTPDDSYTVGGTAISLPNGSSYVRDGYSFAGWSTSLGGATISGAFTPTQDTLLYAKWVDGSYTVTLDAHGGNLSQSSFSVARGTSLTLPIPTRTGFTFEGWFADSATTVSVAAGNAAISPTSSQTLHAKWVQNSLAGINPAHINTLASITVTGSHTWSGTHSASGTGAALSIPNGALPTGTVVNVSFIEDLSRARGIIDSTYAYYTSVAIHWLSGTGDSATVPATAANKPLTLTLTNPSILTGAKVFMIVGGVVTEVAEATQDGQVDINITQDPEFVIAATKPSLPASITASAVSGSQATVSWTAPATNGGAAITGYTVTASPGGATCTTTALTCDITGLSSGTTYSYSVVATNVVGSSSVRSTTVTYIPAPTPSAPSNIITPAPSAPSSSTVETPSGLTVIESSPMPEVASAEIAQSAPAVEEAPGVSGTGIKSGSIAEKIQKQTGMDLTVVFMILILLLLALLVFFITWRYSLAKKR